MFRVDVNEIALNLVSIQVIRVSFSNHHSSTSSEAPHYTTSSLFGPKRDEVIGGWRKLHNEELRNLYCSPSIIRMIKSRRMRMAEHVARMGYRILVGKPKGKRPLGRLRRRWEYNINVDLRETGWGGMDWTGLAQDKDQWSALVS
jgi:hypothetical protein